MSSSSLARMEPLDDVHMNAHECVAPVQVKEIEKPEDVKLKNQLFTQKTNNSTVGSYVCLFYYVM